MNPFPFIPSRHAWKMFFVWTFVLFFGLVHLPFSVSQAQEHKEELSAFEKSLLMHHEVSTSERIVVMGGRKFRRVEYQKDIFYLALQADLSSAADLLVLCGEQQATAFNRGSPSHIQLSARVTKRSRVFVEGLRTICTGVDNKSKVEIVPDIAIGFLIDDNDDPNAILKNKKITINPFSQILGFSAEW